MVSTAIPDDNPELAAAREAGATVLHRGELLGELSRMKRTIAVGGTHGKTTSASMAALALLEAGREPAFLIGGELRAAGTNAAWGAGEWAVIEADESDRSFLKLGRDVAVVTNIELDHHATYANLGELGRPSRSSPRPPSVRVLGPGVELPGEGEAVTFGIDDGGDGLRAENVRLHRGSSSFTGRRRRDRAPGARRAQHPQCSRRAGRPALSGCADRRGCARAREVHRRGPPLRGSTGARRRGRSSTTTTRITRPRCRPRSPRRARWSRAGWWPASSRTSTRAPACSRASSAARWRWRTSSWCWTCTARGSGPRTSRA